MRDHNRDANCCIDPDGSFPGTTGLRSREPSTAGGTPSIAVERGALFADILSQAITGELIGMKNYAAMASLCQDDGDRSDALANSASELRHSERFRRAARDIGVEPLVNVHAPHWHRIRTAFLLHVDAGDLVACIVIQKVMLESFAVAMYRAVAEVAPDRLAQVFRAIADEEALHVDHAIERLRAVHAADPDAFECKLEGLHSEAMEALVEMVAEADGAGHCGPCRGGPIEGSLGQIRLDRASLRGRALNQYLHTLDRVGVRRKRSLAWIARLPA
jgi:fatty aldehyde decarbonylase